MHLKANYGHISMYHHIFKHDIVYDKRVKTITKSLNVQFEKFLMFYGCRLYACANACSGSAVLHTTIWLSIEFMQMLLVVVHIRMVNIFAACLHSSTLPSVVLMISSLFFLPTHVPFSYWTQLGSFSYAFSRVSTTTRQNVEVHHIGVEQHTKKKQKTGSKNRNKN